MSADGSLYFAYGSNLHQPRMRARVPSAHAVAIARLPGYRVAFRKRSVDGSTKCDLEPAAQATAWGVVYRLDPSERPDLDAAEGPGYTRVAEIVTTGDGAGQLAVFTYRANADARGEGRPHDWYRDLVVLGARAHGLPAPWVEAIAAHHADPDPDPERARANRP